MVPAAHCSFPTLRYATPSCDSPAIAATNVVVAIGPVEFFGFRGGGRGASELWRLPRMSHRAGVSVAVPAPQQAFLPFSNNGGEAR